MGLLELLWAALLPAAVIIGILFAEPPKGNDAMTMVTYKISAEQRLWDEVNIFDEMIAELKRRREERLSKIRELKNKPAASQS
jgi:hypothetical protein